MSKAQQFNITRLANGLTVIGEPMPNISSAAFSILVPIGVATDAPNRVGAANILAEMFHKGAGPYDSKQVSDKFEELGANRSHNAGIEVSVYSGSLLGENLEKALELYSTVLLNPRLPEDELGNVRELALQELRYIEDHPSSKVMVELSKRFYPEPFGRCQAGTEEGIKELSIGDLAEYYKSQFLPDRAIISVAGNFNWEDVVSSIEKGFGKWTGTKSALESPALSKESRSFHVAQDTSQLQIALAYPSVSLAHPDYYTARVAVNILSGGMAGRLFIEVREKRGLVYTVSASHSAAKGRAAVIVYAGTTPERGQETLDVIIAELNKLHQGVNEEELNRAKADLKSRLIIQAENSSVRASSLSNDWWSIGRLRTIEEIKSSIDNVTSADIIRHLEAYPISPITLVTLGSKSLEVPK